MSKNKILIIIIAQVITLIIGFAAGHSFGLSTASSYYNEQIKLDLLKDNLDNGSVFEGTLSFFGQNFYLNKENLLQIDNLKESLCQQLFEEGYNCKSGVLVTNNNIDPLVSGYETLKKAKSAINDSNNLINKLTEE